MRETGWCGRDSAGAVDLCGQGKEKNEHSGERHGAPEMLAQPQRAQVAREPRGTCGNGGCEEAEPMARGPAELGAVYLEARPSGLEAAGTRTHTRSHTNARVHVQTEVCKHHCPPASPAPSHGGWGAVAVLVSERTSWVLAQCDRLDDREGKE